MYFRTLVSVLIAMLIPGGVSAGTITAKTADGVTIYGETYFGDLPDNAPLVLLFHKAGSNGRGEYGDAIAPWLNENGFRAIAWDQRSGGDTFGAGNRTVAGLSEGVPAGYCDAYPDLEAALSYAQSHYAAGKVTVWGSSYSAALVFQLAAQNPDAVSGVIGFSPASGGPLANCRARDYLTNVKSRAFILRPASEMELESSQEQMEIFKKHGAYSAVIENGVHGSSMLVNSRTEHNMTGARKLVLDWLKDLSR